MNAKQNLKRYLDTIKVSPAQFYRETGLSNGFLNQGDNISSNNIEIIISSYPDLNLLWLITGCGNMLNNPNDQNKNAYPNAYLNAYPSPKSEDNSPLPTMAAEPNMPHGNAPNLSIYKGGEVEEKQPRRDESSDGLIKHLVEQLNEKSEEIGALKQEVNFLKDRLAQCAENVTGAKGARA